MYYSTKKFGHNLGFSCAFRQWRADSHCRLIHGYSLAFTFVFAAETLDHRGWVVDFGSLKSLKGIIEQTFDHTTVVAEDDPELDTFKLMSDRKLIQLRVLPSVGCESFAEYMYQVGNIWLRDNGYAPRVAIHRVEVAEHEANSAIYGSM